MLPESDSMRTQPEQKKDTTFSGGIRYFMKERSNIVSKKYVYLFSEGNGSMRELLGGKGANLAEMTSLGMPVPHGFTVTTEACTRYYEDGKTIAPEIEAEIFEFVSKLEALAGKKLGDKENPLLVSVRSGARASMPGMMDTILNLGLNDEVVEGIAKLTQNPRFAYDTYRRFIQMFADVVAEVPKEYFERAIDLMKQKKGVKQDTELDADDMKQLVEQFKALYKGHIGRDFPTDPKVQLMESVKAVFRSWDNPRAIYYRRQNGIPSSWGTAVTVQMMVFGNMGNDCGTGVAFTRNPATGEKKFFGEFLVNAQGEDVVAGIRTPQSIDELKQLMPEVYDQFLEIATRLERHYKDMQDMEFTIERGKLFMLQTRNGKRTAQAAMKIACDLVDEGLITEEQAVLLVDPSQLDAFLHDQFNPAELKRAKILATALPASPGAACGQVVFDAETAKEWVAEGKKVILVRLETSPEDIEGMHISEGILTVRGGMTSHAAVVARGMGICCISSCGDITIREGEHCFEVDGLIVNEGDYISLDGSTGRVYLGKISTVGAGLSGDYSRLMGWADKFRKLQVRANAETPADAAQAYKFGAEGIGLVRTEHMFFDEQKIKAVREMILAKTQTQRQKAVDKMHVMQREDFIKVFEAMQGQPVTIRLIDPPLHEFLPKEGENLEALAAELETTPAALEKAIVELHEVNPMMGHRGCRLAVSYPEIAKMQTEAIIEAAITVTEAHKDWRFVPEIMVPLITDLKELKYIKSIIVAAAEAVLKAHDSDLKYMIGTMVETPRAALLADEIATEADFYSFGTNDLTQMTFGLSRDDAASYLGSYYDKKIFDFDPFATLDLRGVGQLIERATELGRSVKPNLKLGICGEHGGDPASVEFCHKVGLNYVSCSPYRVPIARLAAAQAAIKFPRD